ncbi:MAG: 8-oxo-dGTP diphosphatase [Verrucomicrobiales bacterium]|jgi:8-oxo-dGTP diphosphatase|nr:8-oxo-dGTP diphosphatase [Verrucomicrobiales bacterium]
MATDSHSPAAPDWTVWQPVERGALCFIVSDGQILLIHKKRGLGAGKINGPGGRLEAGESPAAAAVRETREEVGVTPLGLRAAGVLRFQFCDGYALWCAVFTASGLTGTLRETDEALPFWAPVTAIPYDRMWADDSLWLPHALAGRCFEGNFWLAGERLLTHDIRVTTGGARDISPPGNSF